eukprot:8734102-Pyramimonas_sp.AAC.1
MRMHVCCAFPERQAPAAGWTRRVFRRDPAVPDPACDTLVDDDCVRGCSGYLVRHALERRERRRSMTGVS